MSVMVDKQNGDRLGVRLREYRVSREWTLEHLSRLTGVSVTALSCIERGFQNPSPLTAQKLKRTLPGLMEA